MTERPTGAVTFLFTDIEGSTAAWENDPKRMAAGLEIHDRVLRGAIESHGGFVFATGGDSFSAAFSSPTMALSAAIEAQRGLAGSDCGLRVRMGVHSGEAVERDGNYFGPALNRTARLMSIGHGGQVLVSDITKGLVAAAGFEFLDLGEHRLADLSRPIRIVQLTAQGLNAEFPPLRSAVTTDNLPRLGEVFGRSTDIDRIADLLTERRLVTLTGAGGIGKTTLATSVAARMVNPFPDGRWLVDLTDLPPGSERAAIAGAVAGVDDRFGSVEALAPRQMLLVLDNCEHVLDGVRSYLDDLLHTAPQVTVLATSREPIGIRGERVLPVAPLSVDEDSTHASAVDLFVTRATEAGVTLDLDADRHTITAICRQVGGLPLAIELAAARTAVMTPTQILDRLGDRLSTLRGGRRGPEHHRTIEATISWSYDLLDDDTRELLRFLSVFEGGFDLEQAEAVGGDEAVDRLADLVRKSLVNRDGDRFSMLEAVRQYATARLEETEERSEALTRHFEFFAFWAHHRYHRDEILDLTDAELRWINDNLANLRKAVRVGAAANDPTPSAEIAAVLWPHRTRYLYRRLKYDDWFEPLLDRLDQLDPQLQMSVLQASGTNSYELDNPHRAEKALMAAYDIYRRTGLLNKWGSTPHNSLGVVSGHLGRWDEAETIYREGIEVMKANHRPHHSLSHNLGTLIWTVRDDPARALDIIREGRTGDSGTTPWEVGVALIETDILIEIGELDQARAVIESRGSLKQPKLLFHQQIHIREFQSRIAYKTGDMTLACILLLENHDSLTNVGHGGIYRQVQALHLARVLRDLNAHRTAQRVLDEIRVLRGDHMEPVHQRQIEEVERQLEAAQSDIAGGHEALLSDAIQQALEAAIR